MNRRTVLTGTAAAWALGAAMLALAACADSASVTASRSTDQPHAPVPRHAIDWTQPIRSPVTVSRATARTVGRLAFDPIVPAFDLRETEVQITDPAIGDFAHAAVAFLYDFPPGGTFPAGGRVVVVEAPTALTDADLTTMATTNGGHFHLVTIGDHPAVLIEGNGVGRVRLVRQSVAIDITGPAVPPDVVLRLADAVT